MNNTALQNPFLDCALYRLSRVLIPALLLTVLSCIPTICSPTFQASPSDDKEPVVVENSSDSDVFGIGRSIIVRGNVKRGAMSFGGDVVVEGSVDGDVAAIGGSVKQMAGSRIGGDVLVIGGTFYRDKDAVERDPANATVMVAGYEDELRNLMRDPTSLLVAHLSYAYFAQRILSVLFWFVVSLALTAATPGAVSRALSRLQLTAVRVALIGLLGSIVIVVGVPVALKALPTTLSVLVMIMAILLTLVAYLFGRVVIHAATGRSIQRILKLKSGNSESLALLLGTLFWTAALSLPYIWPLIVAGLMVASLGLALTARYRMAWKRESVT